MTLDKLYNFESFSLAAASVVVDFKDSAAGTILGRNLEAIDPTVFKQQYAGLTFLQSGVDVSNIGGWSEFITKIKRNITGGFKSGDDTANGTGKISVGAEKDLLAVFPYEGFSDWSDDETKQADLENRNLVSELIEAHDTLYHQAIDEIGYVGQFNNDGTQKSTGLLNFTGFTTSASATTIELGTAQAGYDEIAGLINRRKNAALNNAVLMPTDVVFPIRVLNFISTKILNTAGSEKSVLAALKINFPEITFGATSKAEATANGGPFLANSTTVCYSSNARAMVFRIPLTLEIGEIVKPSSFKFKFDSRFRIGGLDVIEDSAGELLTGL